MISGKSNNTRWWICLALLVAIGACYWRVFSFDFVNYDDPDYVSENPMVRGGLSLKGMIWAFTHCYASNWHPLTWISHMIDCQLFGANAGGPHVVNVLFHAANAILLFLLLYRLTQAQWRSALVAALFALHPLHVESVAWISERKDVLSTFFGLLSLLAYVRYVNESKTQSPKSKVRYAFALILFMLSLLAKPMLVTLPFVMLLLDFWPLQRVENFGWRTFFTPQFGKLAREKWPWFALTVASSVITFFAQKTGGAILSTEHFPLSWRLTNAIISYFDYSVKAGWPVRLAVFYPLQHNQPAWLLLVALAFLTATSIVATSTAKRWPFLLVGWFWFLGSLVPVIGLVQVGSQAMADRYSYFPFIGLFIAVVWGASNVLGQKKSAAILSTAIAAGVLVIFAITTVFQLQYWKNSFALFTHTLAVTRDNAPANNNLGTALATLGRREEALAHYTEAARIEPENARYQNNLATALVRAGQPDAAVSHYQAAIAADPQSAEAYSNLGALFLAGHRVNEAITNLTEAVRVNPGNPEVRNNLANALAAAGKMDDALAQYAEAVRLNPADATVRLNAGLALLKAGRVGDALAQFTEAVRLNPSSTEARYEFGRLLFSSGQFPAALEQLSEAVKLKPNYAAAEFYQSATLGELGRYDDAITTAQHALESAQHAGQTNLAARIQEALGSYKTQHPFRPKTPDGK